MRLRPFSRRPLLPALVVIVLGATAAAAGAQANTQVGGRVGYNFQTDEVMFSTNLSVPVTSTFAFYPSLDVYDPNQGSRFGFNGDLKIAFPVTSGPQFYMGGGVGVLSRTIGDFSSTNVGTNLLMGVESRQSWGHPFVEAKIHIRDQTQLMFFGGVNFPIGR